MVAVANPKMCLCVAPMFWLNVIFCECQVKYDFDLTICQTKFDFLL